MQILGLDYIQVRLPLVYHRQSCELGPAGENQLQRCRLENFSSMPYSILSVHLVQIRSQGNNITVLLLLRGSLALLRSQKRAANVSFFFVFNGRSNLPEPAAYLLPFPSFFLSNVYQTFLTFRGIIFNNRPRRYAEHHRRFLAF